MLELCGLSHINVVVDDIVSASLYYEDIFLAKSVLEFPRFKNTGFSKAAGFIENASEIEVTVRFIEIPGAGITIELMQYHTPKNLNEKIDFKKTYDIGGPRHIALLVRDIDSAFQHFKKKDGIYFINSSAEYAPHCVSEIKQNDFYFFDPQKEKSAEIKENACIMFNKIKFFYFIDKYGVQWELEEGHDSL